MAQLQILSCLVRKNHIPRMKSVRVGNGVPALLAIDGFDLNLENSLISGMNVVERERVGKET